MLIALNKPYGVLCQFTDPQGRPTLADYVSQKGVYAAGRLDKDSEGLLLLTDNGKLQNRLAHPKYKQAKTYLVEVERCPDEAALQRLRTGIELNDGMTLAAKVKRLTAPPAWLWRRDPPVRFRASIPTAWLEITITEGRNRQVRRMTAAVGYPTLRLVRVQIGQHKLANLLPGETRIISQ